MKETAVPILAIGPDFTEWINRAHREQTAFVVMDGETPIARLAPIERHCTGRKLAKVVASAQLDPEEASGWTREMRIAGAALSEPEDRWQQSSTPM